MQTVSLLCKIYDETITLLHATRDYVQEQGPLDIFSITVDDGMAMTLESTRITSRLTHIMAWYLTQQALLKGEIDLKEARSSEYDIPEEATLLDSNGEESPLIPMQLQQLLKNSRELYQRVSRLNGVFRRHTA